ncbi:MAG: hypothetical protein D6818_08135, partial [Bacteroidetes bacterium]
DRAAGLRTLPVVRGLAFAKRLSLVLLALLGLALAVVALWCLLFAEAWLTGVIVLALTVQTWRAGRLLWRAADREEFGQVSRRMKQIMVGGLLAFLAF